MAEPTSSIPGTDNNLDTIDLAIQRCEQSVKDHRKVANGNLYFTGGLIILFVLALFAVSTINAHNQHVIDRYTTYIDSSWQLIQSVDSILPNRTKWESISGTIERLDKSPALRRFSAQYYDSLSILLAETRQNGIGFDQVIHRLNRSADQIKEESNLFDKAFIPLDKSILFIVYGVLIFLIGLQTSFYRFQLKEIAKYEHYLFAFSRIRIAGSNYQQGFADIVREALAKEAFVVKQEKSEERSGSKNKKIESPIPGHPGSDVLTLLLNKMFENVELKATPKKDTE